MAGIGPELPPHLLNQSASSSEPDSFPVGPQIPANLLQPTPTAEVAEDSADEDDYAPALPPDLVASRAAGPQRKIQGPALPHSARNYAQNDSDDDDIGPQPLPAGFGARQEVDAVKQFMEKEENRRKQIEVRFCLLHCVAPILIIDTGSL